MSLSPPHDVRVDTRSGGVSAAVCVIRWAPPGHSRGAGQPADDLQKSPENPEDHLLQVGYSRSDTVDIGASRKPIRAGRTEQRRLGRRKRAGQAG